MPRIKKRGLDYFPMNTDFIHDRLVRRIMKREGDAALAVLLEVYSYIYAGEGYYVCADSLFYEDISANLYEKSAEDVKRIIALAVEYGIFDATLFSREGVLSTADIQRQYLFSTKRRSISQIEPRYCLIADTAPKEKEGENASANDNVTITPENATANTHSIAQQNTAQHSVAEEKKEYPLQSLPTEQRGQEEKKEETSSKWTNETINRLQPPADGLERNLDGLIYNLRQYRISPAEQYAIICKSNFGVIGHPVWKGFYTLRESHGKIKMPGRYLLSLFTAH